ncbi:hypothetical protein [Sporosarcina ureilytica]|uniref:DUF401 domain-containing protein n=1 Tax=Sporosarcina ureilytica TaxID=298596 RepID=A0A1D8JIT6_9BACL|nr:hypothetical protein [Sporosarcina ureilytica]AOV08629.1 hypothetical protein BI350_14525 [Sporosarcina ureilytica]
MSKSILLPKVQGLVIFILALLILFYPIVTNAPMPPIILYGCIMMVILLFPTIKKSTFIISLMMLLIGHFLFWYYELGFPIWKDALSINLGLISLFAFVPMLLIPIEVGGYIHSIEAELKKLHSKQGSVFILLSIITFLLSSVVNLAIIRVLFPIFKKTNLSNENLGRAMLIGFTSTNLWSPYFASVAIILHFMDLPYTKLGPFIFLLAIFHFIFGNMIVLLLIRKTKKLEYPDVINTRVNKMDDDRKKIARLLIIMVVIFFALFLLEKMTGQKMTTLVSLVGLVGSILWIVLAKEKRRLKHLLSKYIFQSLPKIGNEVSLFISAGFFGIIIMSTPLNQIVSHAVSRIGNEVPLIFLIGIIILLPVVLAFIGVHQIITVTLLATSISPDVIGLSTVSYGVLLAAAWCHSSAASPFSPINLTISSVLNKSSFKVGIGNNYLFFIGSLLITVFFVYFIR